MDTRICNNVVIYRDFGGTIFSNARRNASPLSSASIARAISTKRFDCSGLSGFGCFRFGFGVNFGFFMLTPG